VTIGEWLETRQPEPPAALGERLRAALGPALARPSREVPEAALEAAAEMLGDLLRAGCVGREHALALLAADALVTYAFEAASEEPDSIAPRADDAMRRVAGLATIEPGTPGATRA
jgi:hypothetical protein